MTDEAADAVEVIGDEGADAMLDLIAAEMSAPDVSDAHLVEVDEPETPPARPEMIAPVEEVAVAPETAPAIEPSAPIALEPAPRPRPQAESEPSIGSTLVAGGLLRRQGADDPLAALRRLSQAEKIALFS
jgi:hypothetical protein